MHHEVDSRALFPSLSLRTLPYQDLLTYSRMNVSGSFLWISLLGMVYSDQRPRIWNGSPAEKNQFPYHVILKVSFKNKTFDHFCGGTILDDHWVLTAAHCFELYDGVYDGFLFRGQFGGNSPFRPEDYDIVFNTLIIHPHFRRFAGKPVNDIGLLKASEPIISKDLVVKSIQIPEQDEEFRSGRVVVTGAGLYEKNNSLADHLRFAELQLITDEVCMKLWKPSHGFTPEAMVCAGGDLYDLRVVDACGGDSGGPLVYQRPDGTNVVVGIVSYGTICSDDRPNFPAIYTEVAHYSNWIKKITGIQSGSPTTAKTEESTSTRPECSNPLPDNPSSGSFAAIQTSVHMTLIILTSLVVIQS